MVRSVFEDKDGLIWIGSESQGVFEYDRSKCALKQIKGDGSPGTLSNNSIWDITKDNDGIIRIATENNGLDQYDPKTGKFRVFYHHDKLPGSLSDNYTRNLLVDHNGVLWVGTDVGLDKYDPASNTFQHYKEENENNKRKNKVWEIFEDLKDQL